MGGAVVRGFATATLLVGGSIVLATLGLLFILPRLVYLRWRRRMHLASLR